MVRENIFWQCIDKLNSILIVFDTTNTSQHWKWRWKCLSDNLLTACRRFFRLRIGSHTMRPHSVRADKEMCIVHSGKDFNQFSIPYQSNILSSHDGRVRVCVGSLCNVMQCYVCVLCAVMPFHSFQFWSVNKNAQYTTEWHNHCVKGILCSMLSALLHQS